MRELIVLGTASQVPTRHRNHNACFVRWDGEGVLFDPGEGTQRQMLLAGLTASSITRICLTHLHGDHCLGLPGVLQRMALDGPVRPVDLYFPSAGAPFVERLRHASIFDDSRLDVRLRPVDTDGVVDVGPCFSLVARHLDHGPETLGWRLSEPDGRRMDRAALDALGVVGADVGRLLRDGAVHVGDRTVTLDEVSQPRPGQAFAFVMDTRWCDGALELAAGADLLVTEATYADAEAGLALAHGHLTARQAGELARAAGARRLVITHFSQRYRDVSALREQAAVAHSDVVAAEDLQRVPFPHRR